ncbi:glycosyltransferase family 2 protein [Candidatus Daviesbacteria bacterium]|nr:glycosyltransferase family 2 protein [Candidatus Daviesbacteria bacterium]
MKISVCLAVFNEENNLYECLKSVESLADEIVIVDGGSSDKTVNIANEFRAKVIKTDNPANFHINKNKAIDAAIGDWVLQLDADERVPAELKEEIQKGIEDNQYNGYWIPRQNFFLGRFLKKGGQYPDYTLRLYKKGKGRLPAKDVHEQAKVEGEIGYLHSPLLHYRDRNFSHYIDGLDRYTSFIARQLYEQKLTINTISFIDYFFIKPFFWFIKTYFRHKGFTDGFPGFIFSLFSSLRYPIAYIKFYLARTKEKL